MTCCLTPDGEPLLGAGTDSAGSSAGGPSRCHPGSRGDEPRYLQDRDKVGRRRVVALGEGIAEARRRDGGSMPRNQSQLCGTADARGRFSSMAGWVSQRAQIPAAGILEVLAGHGAQRSGALSDAVLKASMRSVTGRALYDHLRRWVSTDYSTDARWARPH